MGSSRYLASFVALIAIFVSFKFYNNPEITEITMSGPEMKVFESEEVLKHVKRMQYVSYSVILSEGLMVGVACFRAVATQERPALASDRSAWAMAW